MGITENMWMNVYWNYGKKAQIKTFKLKTNKWICPNEIIIKIVVTWTKIMKNPSKLVQYPLQIDQKRHQNQWQCVLGPFSASNRAQVGPRTQNLTRTTSPLEPFWPKMAPRGSISGPLENRKAVQNHTFEEILALGPFKNALWRGVPKIYEN